MVANTYGIPVHVAEPLENGSNSGSNHEMALGMGQLTLDLQLKGIPTHSAHHKAIRFPSRDHLDMVHGHGAIGLDFVRELATSAQDPSARLHDPESFPDFVICDMDSGINLSGICMAFAGTRTRVLGAAPASGFCGRGGVNVLSRWACRC